MGENLDIHSEINGLMGFLNFDIDEKRAYYKEKVEKLLQGLRVSKNKRKQFLENTILLNTLFDLWVIIFIKLEVPSSPCIREQLLEGIDRKEFTSYELDNLDPIKKYLKNNRDKISDIGIIFGENKESATNDIVEVENIAIINRNINAFYLLFKQILNHMHSELSCGIDEDNEDLANLSL